MVLHVLSSLPFVRRESLLAPVSLPCDEQAKPMAELGWTCTRVRISCYKLLRVSRLLVPVEWPSLAYWTGTQLALEV